MKSLHKQRGIADLWLAAIAGIAILGLLSGLVYGVTRYINGVDQKGYDRGKSQTEKKYLDRDNQQLRDANDQIQKLQNAARSKEQEAVARQNEIAKTFRKENADALIKKDRVIAGLRDGTTKLYVALGDSAGTSNRCASAVGAATGPGSGNNGAGGPQLLGESDSTFLVTEATRADSLVRRLTAAQALILSQIKTCNSQ